MIISNTLDTLKMMSLVGLDIIKTRIRVQKNTWVNGIMASIMDLGTWLRRTQPGCSGNTLAHFKTV